MRDRVHPARTRPCCFHSFQEIVLNLLTSPTSTLPRTHIFETTREIVSTINLQWFKCLLTQRSPRITASSLLVRIRPISKHLGSIFTSLQRPMDSAPLVSDQNTNTIMGARPTVETVGEIDVNRSDDDLEGYQAHHWWVCQSAKQTQKTLKSFSRST